VKFLAIEHRQDVDSRGSYNKSTALHLASSEGHVEATHILIKHSANLTAQDKDGSTPLHVLSQSLNPNADLAWFLVKHGADATAQDKDGSTPLHQASLRGFVELARYLINHGADTTAQDEDGLTPLHRLSRSFFRDVDLARLLVEHGADATAQDKADMTPLHCASIWGDMDLARLLVEHGADPTAQDKYGWTPLHYASKQGHVDLAQFLSGTASMRHPGIRTGRVYYIIRRLTEMWVCHSSSSNTVLTQQPRSRLKFSSPQQHDTG
jgi:ankyrin repeat protein